MKDFVFKQFSIQQSKDVFRVGTDGVLLGALVDDTILGRGLEIGTGTGLISLMLAQRNPNIEILALDINEEAVSLSRSNFLRSNFSNRLQSQLQDYTSFESQEQYHLIFSNPPYFEANDSSKDVLARQKVMLGFEALISKSSQLLAENGVFSVIIPSDDTEEFIKIAILKGLHLVRKINIFGIEGGNLKRNILDFSQQEREVVVQDFIIEKSPREYSDQYLELTKEFHVFKK